MKDPCERSCIDVYTLFSKHLSSIYKVFLAFLEEKQGMLEMQHLLKTRENSSFLPNLEIDKTLFDKIKFPNGKSDLIGVILFSEIASCYQKSLNLIEDDKGNTFLNKSYSEFSKDFSLTKRQVAEAITRLESLGIIDRTITMLQVGKKTFPNTVLINLTQKGRGLLHNYAFKSSSATFQKNSLRLVSTNGLSHQEGDITLERDISVKRKGYIYIYNNINIYKQTNKHARKFSFEENLEKEGRGVPKQTFIKPTSIETVNFETEKEKWETWAQEAFSWDEETIFSEIKRFFKHHLEKQSLFVDWFKAWKGWCQMSFNALKKAFEKDSLKELTEKGYSTLDEDSPQKDRVGDLDPIQQELKDKLVKFGLNETKATMLLEKFDSARILKNLSYVSRKVEREGVKNKSGYLLKAIFEDYACAYEEDTGQKVEVQKTQAIIQEEEKILLQAIEEREEGELSKKVHKAFLKTLGVSVYASWFKNVNIDRSSDASDKETFILKMESSFCAEWVSIHFREKIKDIFKNLFPSASEIQLIGLNSIYPHKIGL